MTPRQKDFIRWVDNMINLLNEAIKEAEEKGEQHYHYNGSLQAFEMVQDYCNNFEIFGEVEEDIQ